MTDPEVVAAASQVVYVMALGYGSGLAFVALLLLISKNRAE